MKMLYSGTVPESYITEFTLYEDYTFAARPTTPAEIGGSFLERLFERN